MQNSALLLQVLISTQIFVCAFCHTSIRSLSNAHQQPVSLEVSARVDPTYLTKCNSGGLSAKPIASSRDNVTCPCFLQYAFFPDVASVWDIFLLAELDAKRWEADDFEGLPDSYIRNYSAIGVETPGEGEGLGIFQTNVPLEGTFRLIFRARATGVVCFRENSSSDGVSQNFFVFESILPACPVVVPNPPLPSPTAQQRIVGGTEVNAIDGLATYFPWIAVIWQGDRRSICGGSQIAPGYILTAAHCELQKDISAFNVRIGNEEYNKGDAFSISKIWVHEDYELLEGGEAVNDIAILQLADRDLSKDGDLIAYNTNASLPTAGEYLTTAGYGHLSEGWSAPLERHRLRKVDVPMWSSSDCRKVFPNVDSEKHICAGVKSGGCDSCQADSGGPLRYIDTAEGEVVPLVVGIVSFGAGCAQRNLPGVYTNVATYASWIRNVVGGDRADDATSTASSKAGLFNQSWGIVVLAGLAGLCLVLATGLIVGIYVMKGHSGDGEMEAGGEASDVPSTSGIST